MEICSNPLIKIADLAVVVKAVKGFNKDIIVGVDNTFLSPYIIVNDQGSMTLTLMEQSLVFSEAA